MEIKFYDNEKGSLIVAQEKENAAELIENLKQGKEINLLYMENSELKSVKGVYSHHTVNKVYDREKSIVSIFLSKVRKMDVD